MVNAPKSILDRVDVSLPLATISRTSWTNYNCPMFVKNDNLGLLYFPTEHKLFSVDWQRGD